MSTLFPAIPQIKYEGPESDNPLAFKYYKADEKIAGTTMKELLRFSMVYWHTLRGEGKDPFGDGTMERPWNTVSDPMSAAKMRVDALFELCGKLDIPFFCFHDRDIAPEGTTLRATNKMLDEIVEAIKGHYKSSSARLLWGTANMFSHPRFMHGAGSSPEPQVFAYAAAQVKKALEVTKELGGQNYVFWGGREGYESLLNTKMKFEQENIARLFRMAKDYAKEIGFTGQFLIEPKPKEPTKHQYDSDSATCYGFLAEFGMLDIFKLNIETNHATLAGHSIQHELRFARERGILGSVDANQGDELLGWDTDQFPTNLYVTTMMMYEILHNGGLHSGGLNFDAKVRRPSFEAQDIAVAHIAGMDSFARGARAAQKLIDSGAIESRLEQRYQHWSTGLGAAIRAGKESLASLEKQVLDAPSSDPRDFGLASGFQEGLEAIINRYL